MRLIVVGCTLCVPCLCLCLIAKTSDDRSQRRVCFAQWHCSITLPEGVSSFEEGKSYIYTLIRNARGQNNNNELFQNQYIFGCVLNHPTVRNSNRMLSQRFHKYLLWHGLEFDIWARSLDENEARNLQHKANNMVSEQIRQSHTSKTAALFAGGETGTKDRIAWPNIETLLKEFRFDCYLFCVDKIAKGANLQRIRWNDINGIRVSIADASKIFDPQATGQPLELDFKKIQCNWPNIVTKANELFAKYESKSKNEKKKEDDNADSQPPPKKRRRLLSKTDQKEIEDENKDGIAQDLNGCFSMLSRPGQLTDWKCHRCQIRTTGTQQWKLWMVPQILVICLRRYRNMREKLAQKIRYPIRDLDMTKYIHGVRDQKIFGQQDACLKFDLKAVVCHKGDTLTSGHYTTFRMFEKRWYLMDDSNVTMVIENDVKDHSDAYLLFYQQNPEQNSKDRKE